MGTGSSSPFGSYGWAVAAFVAVIIVGAAVGIHVWGFARDVAQPGDPFLDNAALLVVGVALGVGAIGGTASRALVEAESAHTRLDAAGAPPATEAAAIDRNGGGGA